MHQHLFRVVTQPAVQQPRPAKVVQLEARRQARLERTSKHLQSLPPRPAA